MHIDRSAMICVGAATEVEVLKQARAEAEEKAAKEQVARKKHEARFSEVRQELQDAVKKWSPWSVILRHRRPNLPRLARAHKRLEP